MLRLPQGWQSIPITLDAFTAASWAVLDSNRHLQTVVENEAFAIFYNQRERDFHLFAIRWEGPAAVGYALLATSGNGGRSLDETAAVLRSQLGDPVSGFTSDHVTLLGRDSLVVSLEQQVDLTANERAPMASRIYMIPVDGKDPGGQAYLWQAGCYGAGRVTCLADVDRMVQAMPAHPAGMAIVTTPPGWSPQTPAPSNMAPDAARTTALQERVDAVYGASRPAWFPFLARYEGRPQVLVSDARRTMVHLGGGAAWVASLQVEWAGAMCQDIAAITKTAHGGTFNVDWVYVELLPDPAVRLADAYLQLDVILSC